MGAALYIVLNRKIPDFDTFVNGKALSRHEETLSNLALKLGVRPLIEFFSLDPEEDDFEEFGFQPEETQWYSPSEGLITVRALLAALPSLGLDLLETQDIQEDLEEFERVLQKAVDVDAQWHLAVDY